MGTGTHRSIWSLAKRAAMAVTVLVLALAGTSATALTQIDFISDPGDYIGGGQTFSLTPADGIISATSGFGGIRVNFGGPGPSPKTFWDFFFSPMEGTSLVPGNYPSAQRSPFKSPQRPGLDIFGDGRRCNTLIGTFTIHEATLDAAATSPPLRLTPNSTAKGGRRHCAHAFA